MVCSKTHFDEVAPFWQRLQRSFFSEEVREKAFAVADVHSGQIAADIGAGAGFMTEGLLARGLQVIAVDQSEAMLDPIRSKFANSVKLDLRLGSAENLPIENYEVDCAFANMYLHHVPKPSQAIAEMARILKPCGRLVITDLDKHSYQFLKTEHHDRWLGFKREVIRRWFDEAGLKEVSIESVGQNCCAASSCGGECASVGIWVTRGVKRK